MLYNYCSAFLLIHWYHFFLIESLIISFCTNSIHGIDILVNRMSCLRKSYVISIVVSFILSTYNYLLSDLPVITIVSKNENLRSLNNTSFHFIKFIGNLSPKSYSVTTSIHSLWKEMLPSIFGFRKSPGGMAVDSSIELREKCFTDSLFFYSISNKIHKNWNNK